LALLQRVRVPVKPGQQFSFAGVNGSRCVEALWLWLRPRECRRYNRCPVRHMLFWKLDDPDARADRLADLLEECRAKDCALAEDSRAHQALAESARQFAALGRIQSLAATRMAKAALRQRGGARSRR
jgi:hypothetical protein